MEMNIVECILDKLKTEELEKLLIRIDEEMCFFHDEEYINSLDKAFDLVQKRIEERKKMVTVVF